MGHSYDHWFMQVFKMPGLNFCTYLNTVLSINEHQASIAYMKRRNQVSDKIIGARVIEQVDFSIITFGKKKRRINGGSRFMLYLCKIRNCIFLFNRSLSFDNLTLKKHRFRQCCFS